MQLQLEVCDLDLCHFLECKFSQYDHEMTVLVGRNLAHILHRALEKGVLMEALGEGDIPLKYIYCPLGSDRKAVNEHG